MRADTGKVPKGDHRGPLEVGCEGVLALGDAHERHAGGGTDGQEEDHKAEDCLWGRSKIGRKASTLPATPVVSRSLGASHYLIVVAPKVRDQGLQLSVRHANSL